MRVGILGTRDVGRTLANGFLSLGHRVLMGSRTADNPRANEWARGAGERASAGTFADAASFGDIVVLATLGIANEAVLAAAGPENLRGKVVIDATNPLDASAGTPPRLAVGHGDSGGEQVQRFVPGARVVKAFNTVGHPHMVRPDFPDGPADMFLCGNDADAKRQVSGIVEQFGWRPVDLGGIESSRYLEPMCMVWVLHGALSGSWDHAFKLVRKRDAACAQPSSGGASR